MSESPLSEDRFRRLHRVLMTNAAWTSPRPPAVARDFLTGAYAAIRA